MKRHIAHGMWSYARTLAALGRTSLGPSTSRVWFTNKVYLPSTVELVIGPLRTTASSPGCASAKDPEKRLLVAHPRRLNSRDEPSERAMVRPGFQAVGGLCP